MCQYSFKSPSLRPLKSPTILHLVGSEFLVLEKLLCSTLLGFHIEPECPLQSCLVIQIRNLVEGGREHHKGEYVLSACVFLVFVYRIA